jgi:hypothetical protein
MISRLKREPHKNSKKNNRNTMPLYNVKYQIERTPGVDTIYHLKFGMLPARIDDTLQGEVVAVYASNVLFVDFYAHGDHFSSVTLDIKLTKVKEVGFDQNHQPIYEEFGEERSLIGNPSATEVNGKIRVLGNYVIK